MKRNSWAFVYLWPFTIVVRAVAYSIGYIRSLYLSHKRKSRRAVSTVISVGNVSYGGSGKTPCINRLLKDLSGRVGYVSRGYRRRHRGLYTTPATICDLEKSGDEAALLALHHPTLQLSICESKWRALSEIDKECDIVIIDDGLQRYDLPIHFHIATVSALSPYGSPHGLLREPFSRLKTVDLIVVTDAQAASPQLQSKLQSYRRPIVWTTMVLKEFFRPDGSCATFMKGQKMALFSGIAHPFRFLQSMESMGYSVVDHLKGKDHIGLDIGRLRSWIEEVLEDHPTAIVVGTEKDFVRHRSWDDLPVYFARMEMTIVKGAEAYEGFIRACLHTSKEYKRMEDLHAGM